MREQGKRILHLASDEKFINNAIYVFEDAFPGFNHFLIVQPPRKPPIKYVSLNSSTELVTDYPKLVSDLCLKCKEYDCILLHGLTTINSSVFVHSDNIEKFIWILWGAEVYNNKDLFKTETKLLEADYKPELNFLVIKEFIRSILRKTFYSWSIRDKKLIAIAARKINYLAVIHREEWLFFRQKGIINERCKFIPFTYYPLEYIVEDKFEEIIPGKNVLIGNSASNTNNHLEAFRKIKCFDLEKRQIIVPLSYGNPAYAKAIKRKGSKLFGDNFIPLERFLPLNEYNEIIKQCGIVIMNHSRQQGVGNILISIWQGSKVYLSENNTIYHFLKGIGILIFSIEKDLVPLNKQAFVNLSIEVIQKNREILKKEIGLRTINKKLRSAFIEYFDF
jgi:dTDP-N-acetylfucosamine:lipid II N-acetylfucosaminyltransferase